MLRAAVSRRPAGDFRAPYGPHAQQARTSVDYPAIARAAAETEKRKKEEEHAAAARAALRAAKAASDAELANDELFESAAHRAAHEEQRARALERMKTEFAREFSENQMSNVSYSHMAAKEVDVDAVVLGQQVFDFIIIGSGHGGSVAAMRLAQKGYSVLVLEEGRRFSAAELPESGRFRKYLWAPKLGWRGPARYNAVGPVVIGGAACVGGGSLLQRAHMEEAPPESFKDGAWAGALTADDLRDHYTIARNMLGITTQPYITQPDQLVNEWAIANGVSLLPADLPIFFGKMKAEKPEHMDDVNGMQDQAVMRMRGKRGGDTSHNPWTMRAGNGWLNDSVNRKEYKRSFKQAQHQLQLGQDGDTTVRGRMVWSDPYYGGAGPHRSPCLACGKCALGCVWGCKTTLDRGYLFLAEQRLGATVLPNCRATSVRHCPPELRHGDADEEPPRFVVDAALRPMVPRMPLSLLHWVQPLETRPAWRTQRLAIRARRVVIAAGVHGSCDLLFTMAENDFPGLRDLPVGDGVQAPHSGHVVCTASDLTDAGVPPMRDFSNGAVTTSVVSEPTSRIEISRYAVGPGGGWNRFTVLPDAGGVSVRERVKATLRWARQNFLASLEWFTKSQWEKASIYLSHYDDSADAPAWRLRLRRRGRRLTAERADGGAGPLTAEPPPQARHLASHVAQQINGVVARPWLTEMWSGGPVAEEVVGGACVAASPDRGVVGADHQVFGHPGLYVVGSAAVGGSLRGRHPALTVAAMTERAISLMPDGPAGWTMPELRDQPLMQTLEKRSQNMPLTDRTLQPAASV